jgi:hypothetical protein
MIPEVWGLTTIQGNKGLFIINLSLMETQDIRIFLGIFSVENPSFQKRSYEIENFGDKIQYLEWKLNLVTQ